jgi:hypothetical protein
MPWTTPGTAVAGDVLTAAFWNLNVRDNLNAMYTAGTNVVMGTDSTATSITSTTLTDTGLSVAITPSSATSKILIWVYLPFQSFKSSDGNNAGIALVRNTTVIASTNGTQVGSSGATVAGFTAVRGVGNIVYLDSPATASAITYKVQGRVENTASSASMTAQNNSEPSSIVCMEILV